MLRARRWLYEVFADEDARRAHEAKPEYAAAKTRLGALIAGPPEAFALVPVAGIGLGA